MQGENFSQNHFPSTVHELKKIDRLTSVSTFMYIVYSMYLCVFFCVFFYLHVYHVFVRILIFTERVHDW